MIDKSYDCLSCGPVDFECLEVIRTPHRCTDRVMLSTAGSNDLCWICTINVNGAMVQNQFA